MIDLKEIIWEITVQCNNDCAYCGSAGVTGASNPTKDDIITIAKNIAEYPPKEINISGGDPTLIDVDVHKEIGKIFREAGIIPKILINPISLSKYGVDVVSNIVELYDAIGVSINTEEEYSIFCDNYKDLSFRNKITIISNFNKSNLWLFNKLSDLAKTYNHTWQVMATMYPLVNDNAIYESELATTEFFDKINKAKSTYNKIVLADNINAGVCTAGTHSLGILHTGDVVPCLSMRAWNDDIEASSQGNLLNTTLQEIWESKFKVQRFTKFKCCQDHCNNIGKQHVPTKVPGLPIDFPINLMNPMNPTIPKYPTIPSPEWTKPNDYPPNNIVMVYGVNMDRATPWNGPMPEIDTSQLPSWEEIVKQNQK